MNRFEKWPNAMAARLLLIGLYVGPLVALIAFVAYLGVNVPRIDQWFLLDLFEQVHRQEAGFADFFAQFHEHRMLVPRLAFVGMAFATGWNIYYELGLNVAIAAVTFWLIIRVALKTASLDNADALPFHLANSLTGLLIFSWTQYQNWLWGFQIPWFFIDACLVAVVLVLAQDTLSLNKKLLISSLLCGLASFSSAHGLFVWIAIVPSIVAASTTQKARTKGLLIWAGLFVICLVGYFAGYQKPADLAADYVNSAANFLGFFFVSLSAPIAGQPVDVTTQYVQRLVGLGAFVFWLYCALLLYSLSRYSPIAFSRTAPWLSLGLFSIVFALANSYGRSGESVNQALQSRYITPGLLITVAIIQLLSLFFQSTLTRARSLFCRRCSAILIVAAVAFLAVHFNTYASAFQNAIYGDQHHAYSQRREALCVELIHYLSEPGLSECFARDQQGNREKVLRLEAIGLRASPENIEFVDARDMTKDRALVANELIDVSIEASEEEIILLGLVNLPSLKPLDLADSVLPKAVLLSADKQTFVAVADERWRRFSAKKAIYRASAERLAWSVGMRMKAFEAIASNAQRLTVYFYYPQKKVFLSVGEISLTEISNN